MTQPPAELWTRWTRYRDERSFESLVVPELPHALGFARRLGCSAADADDAVQDALARLAAVRDDSPATFGVRAWLCREVHVRARSRLRSERRRIAREAAAAVDPACVSADRAAAAREEVERVLAGLDDADRSAVALRYLHDLDYREMALVLGASEGACRLRVHKALARLRARFGDDAAAMVAALPLPAVRNASALVKGALAKASVSSAATGGVTVMATTAQKVAIAAVAAAALGVAGTLAAQRVLGPETSSAGAADARSDEIAKRDAEIARLQAQLADTGRRDRSRRATEVGADAAARQVPESATGVAVAGAPRAPDAAVADDAAATVVVKKPAYSTLDVLKRSAPWQAALRQVDDPEKRDAAWAEVKRALAGADRLDLLAALETVLATSDVKLDRTGLRDLLLPWVDSADPETRLHAWAALTHTGIELADVEKLRRQILDGPADLRPEMVHRLNWATKGVFDGADADVVLRVLDEPSTREATIVAIQNARLNDAVVARVLEYARTGADAAQHAVHSVLRTLPDKNRDVVAFLLDRAEAGDLSAIEQLRWGIRPADVAYAGERLRKLYDARSLPYARERLVETIGGIGDESSREWLTALRDDAAQDAATRAAATSALSMLDRARR